MEVDLLTRILDKQQSKSRASAKRELGVRLQDRPDPPARPPLRKSRTLSNFYEKLEKERRQKLGLETMVKRQSPRVSVVSEGAELIFVSKKLFLQEANIRSITYPNAVEIDKDLKYERDWSRYKHALIRHVVTRVGREYQPPSCK
nr:hypothetical protein BaRGS_019671 [Batillaria attramentaria]